MLNRMRLTTKITNRLMCSSARVLEERDDHSIITYTSGENQEEKKENTISSLEE